MEYKFTLTEKIEAYKKIKDAWDYVTVEKRYVINNYDDLQNLFLTLVDFSEEGKTLNFEIKKEAIDEEVEG